MSSSVRETMDMLEQKLLSKKPKLEPDHLKKEFLVGFTMIPIECKDPLPIREIPQMTEEESHRLNQAELAHLLKRRCAHRLLGDETATGSLGNFSAAENRKLYWADPRFRESMYPKQEQHWVLQLPDVILEGPATLGTLEARGSGFIFTAPEFQLHFKDTSVKECFFSHGDDRRQRPHQLLFHLDQRVMAGTTEMRNIHFSLAKQANNADRGNELDNFVRSVGRARWDSYAVLCMFQDLDKFQFGGRASMFQDLNKFQFGGVLPSKRTSIFSLTDSALVMLMLPPFYVVPLSDVEFVNLTEVKSGAFDMTVVFQDYSRDVLQICTIDITKLAGIKCILNDADVKYYCNTKKLTVKEWNSILREIVASPKKFIDCGGWQSLHLEDELTLSYYGIAEDPDLVMEGFNDNKVNQSGDGSNCEEGK